MNSSGLRSQCANIPDLRLVFQFCLFSSFFSGLGPFVQKTLFFSRPEVVYLEGRPPRPSKDGGNGAFGNSVPQQLLPTFTASFF